MKITITINIIIKKRITGKDMVNRLNIAIINITIKMIAMPITQTGRLKVLLPKVIGMSSANKSPKPNGRYLKPDDPLPPPEEPSMYTELVPGAMLYKSALNIPLEFNVHVSGE